MQAWLISETRKQILFHMVCDIKSIFLVIELLKLPKRYLQTLERGYF